MISWLSILNLLSLHYKSKQQLLTMEKNNAELIAELEVWQQRYSALEARYTSEVNSYKKNEEELRIKLMFLEGIANSTIDGFLVVNPCGQKILQNQRTIELWKIPQEIVDDPNGLKQVHHVMNMTVNPQQFVAEIDYLRDHPNDRSRDELELTDGTFLDRYSSPVLGYDGKNYGRIWTFHDITQRKHLEDQLIQLNADKDRFISILAHDLRSPFSNLLGFTELLKRNLRQYPIGKVEKMVELIYDTALKAFEFLEDTLLWANVQSKKITYSPAITNITEIITDVADLLGPGAKAKNIKLEYTSKNDLMVCLDVYMFKAILRNLVSNAIKFTHKGGKIAITVIHTPSDTTIKVTDNGIGIAPEILEKLFQSVSIQSSPGTANETGTGLGLLLCKEFVDKHGGKIWIDSKVDEGTTVSFTIPITE
jgi:signal transduction histidine kinase